MPRPVLLVDDSEDDAFFVMRAFKAAGLSSPVLHLPDGGQAIDFFSGKTPFDDRNLYPFPAIVLLDLKMPRVSGFEVLTWIRTESSYPSLPIVVLSSSQQEEDLHRAYCLGANGYLVKPSCGSTFGDLARGVKAFWVDLNVMPSFSSQNPQAKSRSTE